MSRAQFLNSLAFLVEQVADDIVFFLRELEGHYTGEYGDEDCIEEDDE